MQECAQVQGGVDTRYLRRSYCSCSYVSSPTFLHLASGNIVTFSDIWTNFRNIFRALFPPCRRSRLLLWHNKMFTHQISNAARTRQLFSYHSVKGEGEKKNTPPSTLTRVFVLNNIRAVPSHYLFIHWAENKTPTLVRNASFSKKKKKGDGILRVFCVFFLHSGLHHAKQRQGAPIGGLPED